jgi:glycerate 2-kinase
MRKCYSDYNVRKFVIGSGGSAFSDGGFGAVQALGVFDFLDEAGRKVDEFVDFGDV